MQFASRPEKGAEGECRRIMLWIFWTFNLLINAVYCFLTFLTAYNLLKTYNELKVEYSNTAWHAPIAASILGGLMVFMFNVLSCIILIKKTINRSGPGFGYGFIMAWCFVMAFFTLLCGLVLDSFSGTVASDLASEPSWGAISTGVYSGTVVFCFVCMGFYVVFFICLAVFSRGISKQLGLFDKAYDDKMKQEMAAMGGRRGQSNNNNMNMNNSGNQQI
ncbi:MAG: hypothetical protein WDW36_009888 [Sanguina aurantia]